MTREDINRINSQYLNDCENTGEMEEIFDLAIKALEQEPRWIPVSERLPEESGEYLVSGIDDEDENYKYVNLAYYAHLNDYDDIYEGQWQDLIIDEKVIAWMPLPEAYTGGMEEGQK